MSFHKNDGKCPGCQKIFDRYPGFYQPLRTWFEELQKKVPEAHISEAGRGEIEQDVLLKRKATKAKWKQSAHNWNAAIDIFRNKIGFEYKRSWYEAYIISFMPVWINWYGAPLSKFRELPHFELRDWESKIKKESLKLVE